MEDCLGSSTVDEIVAVISNMIGIVLLIAIGIVSIRKVAADEKYEMHLVLEVLYFTAIITACIILTGSTASILACKAYGRCIQIAVLLAVVHIGYIVICSALLGSLIIRLYITFDNTHWKLCKQKVALSLLFLLCVDLFWIGAGVAYWFHCINMAGFYIIAFIGMIIYILDSMWAVCNFASNLLSLAKLRAAVKINIHLEPEISQKPQKMIELSSKYCALFMVAIGTTMLSFAMTSFFRIVLEIHPGILWSIDCVVNTLCLYLYHNFAADHYDRFCNYLDSCCRGKMMKNVKMDLIERKETMTKLSIAKMQSDDTECADCHCKSTMSDISPNDEGADADYFSKNTIIDIISPDEQGQQTPSSRQSDLSPQSVDSIQADDPNSSKREQSDHEDETNVGETVLDTYYSQSTAL